MNAVTTVSSRVGSYSNNMVCSSISSWTLDTATCRSCRWIAEYPAVLKYVRLFQGAWGCDPGSVTLAQQNEVEEVGTGCQLMAGNHYQFTTDVKVWHQHAPACFMSTCSVQILLHDLKMTMSYHHNIWTDCAEFQLFMQYSTNTACIIIYWINQVIPCSVFFCLSFSSSLVLSAVPSWLLSATPTRTHCLEEGLSPDWTDSGGGETVHKYPPP